jgi:fructose-bisphosphate aldolase class II
VITDCLERGWNSVLFDASTLPVEENQRQSIEVVKQARTFGAHVEGEIESITGVEDGIGTETPSARQTLEVSLRYIEATGVDVFAPAIGNAHGVYKREPVLDFQRVTDIVEAHPIPIALHGGSGLTDEQFQDLIARGCAKVNISTALKITYMKSNLAFLTEAEAKDKWDPPSLFSAVRSDIVAMTVALAKQFGSAGKAD